MNFLEFSDEQVAEANAHYARLAEERRIEAEKHLAAGPYLAFGYDGEADVLCTCGSSGRLSDSELANGVPVVVTCYACGTSYRVRVAIERIED